ncbi:hypothetical protein Bpro_0176 [Polaromonas sp. JS666]|nr:hypothetical protein Bpro_0176 [Polaromonas sp. JS666]
MSGDARIDPGATEEENDIVAVWCARIRAESAFAGCLASASCMFDSEHIESNGVGLCAIEHTEGGLAAYSPRLQKKPLPEVVFEVRPRPGVS